MEKLQESLQNLDRYHTNGPYLVSKTLVSVLNVKAAHYTRIQPVYIEIGFPKTNFTSARKFLIFTVTIDCLRQSIILWLGHYNRLSRIIDCMMMFFYNRLYQDNRLYSSSLVFLLSSDPWASYSLFSTPASFCMQNPIKAQQKHCKCDHCVMKLFKEQTCIKLET